MKIDFYGKENCPKCIKTKALLDSRNIQYDLHVIGVTITREYFLFKFPTAKTVPFFVVEGSTFTDVYQMIDYFGGPRNIG